VIVVSNTSPITNLAAINQLNLLQQLYSRIIIPEAVTHELTNVGTIVPGATEVQTFEWIQVQTITNRSTVISLQLELDEGEAEAIALASELKADLLLLDERRGYQVPSRYGLRVKGVLGVLIAAKSRRLIPAVKPVMDDLIGIAGFWVTEQLYNRVLQMVSE
jgi:predicted nucleic acid-binding protein